MAESTMKGIELLLELNKKSSKVFRAPDATMARKLYRLRHPTAICATKCMDGRLNLAVITQTQPGIIQPWRNLGGKFDLGWPYFGELIQNWVQGATNSGHSCLVLVTYHFSKGDSHRGCRGFNYDTHDALLDAEKLKAQFERVFGKKHTGLYPVVVGIETDEDAILIHGENGEVLNMAQQILTEDELGKKLQVLFPDMEDQVLLDFLPLLLGNQKHIEDVRKLQRPIADIEHKEWVLGVGRGFDWLHSLNTAFIVGPYSPDLASSVTTAGKLLWENIESKRIDPANGIVLMASTPCAQESGFEWTRAQEKSNFLAKFTMNSLEEQVPQLLDYIKPLVGVVNVTTREFIRQDF